ncbi:DUF4097 domain-containing protein [Bacillus sp. FJAT-29790]|uniref:LiaG family protein n=1 Tax=Bacillus sp. FJAT-29790 TaxID=1895002 RepID=UPI001C2257C7|nr:DUF4097 family beta strand repeat-containing protein [Bacillus sp. FJAT-29790]MBU8880842.1 DUF4097 domain-containing protein [Bacillus sp. FJAT-29790]
MKRIIFIFLVLVGLYLLWSSNLTSWLSFGKGGAEASLSKTINMIEVDVSGIRTAIIPENRTNIKADLDGKGKVTVKTSGDKIIVEYKRSFLNGFQFFKNKSQLNIYIPEDYHRSMAIDIGSGHLTFAGHSKKQPMKLEKLTLDLSSGKADLKNLKTAEFKQDGSSGMLTIDHLITKTGTVEMSSGYVKIKHYEGKLDAEVTSGKLDIQMDELTDRLDVRVSSGHVKLDLPKNADFSLKGKVNSGMINCNLPLSGKIQTKHGIEGVHGSGKHMLDLSVSSGIIDLH